MLNNGTNTNCPFENEIISYIYDEMSVVERPKFETHLADCSVCTDEFAAISEARFSVFEWQKEFADLPTPEIVIPYETKRRFVEKTEHIGFFEGLRGWLKPLQIAFAASLVVVFGVGFLMLRSNDSSGQPIASNNNVQQIEIPNTAPVKKNDLVKQREITQPEVAVMKPKTANKDIQKVRTAVRQPVAAKQMVATTLKKQNVGPVTSTPVLSNYEVEDDNSLRLADLFADIDS